MSRTVNDYTVNKKGDIGVIIRIQTMRTMFEFQKYIYLRRKEEIILEYEKKHLLNHLR